MDTDGLGEQVDYYRARAPEYDDWWERRGRYDRGDEFRRRWDAEVAEVEAALDAFTPSGSVLELAAGTGNWTRHVARHADRVTAVDASGETLAINRTKLDDLGLAGKVEFVEADLFSWEPDDRYDVVFFSFWLTHVPDERFEAFWAMVDRALRPGGRVRLLDNAHPERAVGVPGSPLEVHYAAAKRAEPAGAIDEDASHVSTGQGPIDLAAGRAVRTLADGRQFEIVKRFWQPAELEARLATLGWHADIATTEHFFLHGAVTR